MIATERRMDGGCSTFASRLDYLVNSASGGNVLAFSRQSGIGDNLLRKYLAGSAPGMDKVVKIAKALHVNLLWPATGDGPQAEQTPTHNADHASICCAPHASPIDATVLTDAIETVDREFARRGIALSAPKRAQLYALMYAAVSQPIEEGAAHG